MDGLAPGRARPDARSAPFTEDPSTVAAGGITKALVERHGATITVRSSPQTGTTFTIDLAGDGTSFAQVTASPAADA